MRASLPPGRRRAFTIAETVLALGVLAVALTLVAEMAVQSLRERGRSALRGAAQEEAVNVLEAARACPWEKLDAGWAAAQALPAASVERGFSLKVQVEAESKRPGVKRVVVEVVWPSPGGGPVAPVKLVGLFAGRTHAEKKS